MSISAASDGTCVTISVSGRFDYTVHKEFRATWKTRTEKRYVVDLENTEYLDSAALGMLLLLRDHAGITPVELRGANSKVKRVLAIANFDRLFAVR